MPDLVIALAAAVAVAVVKLLIYPTLPYRTSTRATWSDALYGNYRRKSTVHVMYVWMGMDGWVLVW